MLENDTIPLTRRLNAAWQNATFTVGFSVCRHFLASLTLPKWIHIGPCAAQVSAPLLRVDVEPIVKMCNLFSKHSSEKKEMNKTGACCFSEAMYATALFKDLLLRRHPTRLLCTDICRLVAKLRRCNFLDPISLALAHHLVSNTIFFFFNKSGT